MKTTELSQGNDRQGNGAGEVRFNPPPGIHLDWNHGKQETVLEARIFLTVDCRMNGMELSAVVGKEDKAAIAAFMLGQMSVERLVETIIKHIQK